MRESAELAAEEQLEETTDRQLEEIDEQMRAWSRVSEHTSCVNYFSLEFLIFSGSGSGDQEGRCGGEVASEEGGEGGGKRGK